MKSIMVDIETLSTEKTACVISIGVCAFDQDGIKASDGWAIHTCDWHGEISGGTVKWWSEQNEAAREYSFKGSLRSHAAAMGLAQFVRTYGGGDKDDEVWANDPDFDIVILQAWWKRAHGGQNIGPFPFHYRASRSFRTITAEARRLGVVYDGSSAHTIAHNPIDDACRQARAVIQIRHNLIGATA